ncbi:hypothetical protein BGC07_10815 [Piscirickettsia litoralis]|uniref:Major facilitator superfamily (MFS) profile domain-containing protein n=1 Tax=Piscirickettsia litoralis TaxID=1891921 RepID=A0ABX3A4E8_9GAMM|nr:hypothetical protein BGC07_10815 [Piscirickettsia litoralis]
MNSKKVSLATSGGNALEWYDFSIYDQLAPIIATLFFPSKDLFTSLLLAFSAYFLSFAVRPIGGVILGKIGDRYGRKKVLLYSATMMSICTFCMALLPTYGQIGWLASILFISLRLIQALSISTEFTGSTSYQIERHSKKMSIFRSFSTVDYLSRHLTSSPCGCSAQLRFKPHRASCMGMASAFHDFRGIWSIPNSITLKTS